MTEDEPGLFLPAQAAQELHDYLMTRPCTETLGLVLMVRGLGNVKKIADEEKGTDE